MRAQALTAVPRVPDSRTFTVHDWNVAPGGTVGATPARFTDDAGATSVFASSARAGETTGSTAGRSFATSTTSTSFAYPSTGTYAVRVSGTFFQQPGVFVETVSARDAADIAVPTARWSSVRPARLDARAVLGFAASGADRRRYERRLGRQRRVR